MIALLEPPSPLPAALQLVFWSMIDPMGSFRVRWDVMILLLLLYVMVTAPFTMSFDLSYSWTQPLGIVDITIDAIFVVDIYLNFRTGVVGEALLRWDPGPCLHVLAAARLCDSGTIQSSV